MRSPQRINSCGARWVIACAAQVSAATGAVLWEYQDSPDQPIALAAVGPGGDVYLVADALTRYANSTLYAVDGATGALRWSYASPTGHTGSSVDGVATDGKGVYVTIEPDYNVNITALDVHTGDVLWSWGLFDSQGGGTMYLMANNTIAVAVTGDAA